MFLRSAPIDVEWFTDDDWWEHVDVHAPDECWPWMQSCGSHGYGQTWDGRTVRLAHRVAWTLVHGPIPEDMTVDHICRNRPCCNPWHLRLLSNVDNARDNGAARRTHCPQGHPYDEANTYVNARGHRQCRACRARW
jgi:hypothetical protein